MNDLDRIEMGGGALAVGYLVVLATLYRAPTSALGAATASPQSVLYFLVLPVAGMLAGIYASLDGSFSGLALFLFGSYLGFLGLALAIGAALSSTPISLPLAVGLVALVLAALALVAGLLQFATLFQFGSLGVNAE